MATKKIILDFLQQPIATKGFRYKIYIAGSSVNYVGLLDEVNLTYKVGGNSTPLQIGIGADLDETIDNTLAFLESVYYKNGFVGGFAMSIAYARVNNTIEITITSASTESQITIWNVNSSEDYIFIRPENPCEKIFLSNLTSANANPIFALTPGTYQIKNIELNTTSTVVIPSTFDCLFEKGFNYAIQQSGTSLLFFAVTASINETNLIFIVENNNLTINLVGTEAIVEYSIDGITYQTENIFQDIPDGNTTLYVRDNYYCIKTFVVVNNGQTNGNVANPYVYVSEGNSIRFIRRITHGNCGNYKNVYNTLSCEENVQVANKYVQLFQSCDTAIKTQVKTSYQNLEIYAGDTEIIANKIVNNIGLEDKRDCTYYSLDGKLACYFTSGNTYDYDTLDINGSYELNGNLPAFGVVGTWIETQDYGLLQIANIVINDSGIKSLVFDLNITISSPTVRTIQTIYNRDTFDIWEFTFDMSLFLNTEFTIGVRFYQTEVDVNFPNVFYISEKIKVKTRWERSIELIWRNSKNTDIYFYSGIEMKNRLNFARIGAYSGDGTIENQLTDSQVISIDATNYHAFEFIAFNLSTGMVRKINQALKHDFLVIENVPYKLSENPEIERQGESNYYKISAKLLEAGDVWNQGTANTQTIYSNVELIGLLQGDGDSEYIRTI